jgi:hypothetical protein
MIEIFSKGFERLERPAALCGKVIGSNPIFSTIKKAPIKGLFFKILTNDIIELAIQLHLKYQFDL